MSSILRYLRLISVADLFTAGNGVFGALAIYFFITRSPDIALGTGLIFLGMLCDGADGYMARKFGTRHNYGHYLDSMSDSITFGLAPGVLVFTRYHGSVGGDMALLVNALVIAIAATVVVLAWMRLYRFTLKDHGKSGFYGLATPGMTFFVLLCAHILTPDAPMHVYLALALTLMAASLMVAYRVRYPKIHGPTGFVVAVTTILAVVVVQIMMHSTSSPEILTLRMYRAVTYLALGIIAGYIFIAPFYMKMGLEGWHG